MTAQLGLFNIEELPRIINVAQVKQLSPFRYPGGKTWLVPYFKNWISSLPSKPKVLIEPFAGGGIISLTAAYCGLVDKCIMIEKDESVAAVWSTIFYGDYQWLINRILSFNLTPDSAREVINAETDAMEELAFKTILRNRVNHGGILAPGSGLLKSGENGKGITSRWYPETITKRIATIAQIKDKFEFHQGNAFDFIEKYINSPAAAFFVDPPYTASLKKAGRRLYQYYDINHGSLFSLLSKTSNPFMLTYDFDQNVIEMAEQYKFDFTKVPMKGTHHSVRYELLITRK